MNKINAWPMVNNCWEEANTNGRTRSDGDGIVGLCINVLNLI